MNVTDFTNLGNWKISKHYITAMFLFFSKKNFHWKTMTQSSKRVLVECIDFIEIFHAKLWKHLISLRSCNFISTLDPFCSKIVKLIMKCSCKLIFIFFWIEGGAEVCVKNSFFEKLKDFSSLFLFWLKSNFEISSFLLGQTFQVLLHKWCTHVNSPGYLSFTAPLLFCVLFSQHISFPPHSVPRISRDQSLSVLGKAM